MKNCFVKEYYLNKFLESNKIFSSKIVTGFFFNCSIYSETYRSIWKIACKFFEGFKNLIPTLGSLKVFGAGTVSLLDTIYPEAEVRSGTDGLPPDHVPRFRNAFTPMLFFCWRFGIYLDHFFIHVLEKRN